MTSDLRSKIAREARIFRDKDKKAPPRGKKVSLSRMLNLPTPDFLEESFYYVLGRLPHPEEREKYRKWLHSGRFNRIDILGRLRRSREGRRQKARVPGLMVLYGLRALARRSPFWLPFAARFLRGLSLAGSALVREHGLDEARLKREDTLQQVRRQSQQLQLEVNELKRSLARTRQDLYMVPVMGHAGSTYEGIAMQERSGVLGAGSGMSFEMYARFEDIFRGTRAEIMQGLRVLLPLVRDPGLPGPGKGFQAGVLDLACGRGEWLELLESAGISCVGVDWNPRFVQSCCEAGLNVLEGEAFSFLGSLPSKAVPVISAFHFIEHLPPSRRMDFLQEVLRVLAPGGLVLLETPNPRNILVGAGDFYRDPDHRVPVFPDTLEFIGQAMGFEYSRACYFDAHRKNMLPADQTRFNRLEDYIRVSRDFVWTGRKPA